MSYVKSFLLCACVLTGGVAWGQNRLPNGDFEGQEFSWAGEWASPDKAVFHGGKAALRLDATAKRPSGSARTAEKIALNQQSADPLMAAVWLRVEPGKSSGDVRAGMSIRLEFIDGTALYWYAPFEVSTEEMNGAWVYREGAYKPRSPVASASIGIYLKNMEGRIWADDIYFGPVCDLPAAPIGPAPVSVTGDKGRFSDWATFRVDAFRPQAHVFHLAGENSANIAIDCSYEVTRPAPIVLNSAWGSQYWTLYHLGRREVCQIYTDERLNLSKAGPNQTVLKMNQWCDDANPLAKGGYLFITDYQKNFLIYASDKPTGTKYEDPKTGATFPFWDAVKLSTLKHMIGPEGVAAPFSIANLASYELGASARRSPGAKEVAITPFLKDADGDRVPLIRLDLRAKASTGDMAAAKEVLDKDGLPTGEYVVERADDSPVEICADVSLMLPSGLRKETLRATTSIEKAKEERSALPGKVHLHGWCDADYSLAQGAADGPASMERMVADAARGGVGALIVHAKSGHGCSFRSNIVPAEQQSPWDHVAAAVEAGKKHGIKIYAGYILGIAHKDDAKLHPDWAMVEASGNATDWYCCLNPDVRNYHIALMKELASNYAIDGIALDFCRPGGGCFCERCQKLFEAKYAKSLKGIGAYDPDWVQWKLDAITDYMRQLAKAAREAKPGIRFGGYVWSRIAPDKDRAGQDFPRWLKEGTFDFVYMGNYRSSLPFFRSVCRVCRQIADAHRIAPERIMPMPGIAYIQQSYRRQATNDAMLARQLEIVSEEGLTQAGLFSFSPCRVHLDVLRKHSADARREE